MGSVNRVTLIGNLGRDAEMRYTSGGTAVATLNLATTESWTDKGTGQRNEKTEWHRVILWDRLAESLKDYLVKGKQLYVEGQLQTRMWEKDGVKHYTTEIRARNIVLLGGTDRGGGRHGGHVTDEEVGRDSASARPVADEPILEDEIPF